MKKTFIFALFFLAAYQYAGAVGVTVHNLTDKRISVDPIWSGSPIGFRNFEKNESFRYSTGIHHLRGLRVLVSGNEYFYNCENYDWVIEIPGRGAVSAAGKIKSIRFGEVEVHIFSDPEYIDIQYEGDDRIMRVRLNQAERV